MGTLRQSGSRHQSGVWLGLCLLLTFFCSQAQSPAEIAAESAHQMRRPAPSPDMPTMTHHRMSIDRAGSMMNHNDAALPPDCSALGPDLEMIVYAGREFAAGVNGRVFGYSEHEYEAEPCSRITVTLVNNDAIRHQWMIHGLPKYLYPGGMFHLEAAGGQSRTGTFIIPSDEKTYLVHCDMTQHMEKGMKAQLIVGGGSGNLWSIPGVSQDFLRDAYFLDNSQELFVLSMIIGLSLTVLLLSWRCFF